MSGSRERLQVDERGHRQRLDRYLARLGRWGSRARVQRLIEAGGVSVAGRAANADTILRSGQIIVVETPVSEPALAVEAEPIALDILFEDDWILVIHKPAGLVVHPAPGHARGTLVNALLHHWKGARPGMDPLRPGIVHRLDKDTSGVLVIAKDPDTLTALAKQFQERSVEKEYLAAVWGRPDANDGMIDAPIGRNPVHRQRMAVQGRGRPAQTRYEVIRSAKDISWLRLYPRTGRTHQIRVHLASIGHPIVGDSVYGGKRRSPLVSRQALHAERITLSHPQTGERRTFRAPLAEDLRALWDSVG